MRIPINATQADRFRARSGMRFTNFSKNWPGCAPRLTGIRPWPPSKRSARASLLPCVLLACPLLRQKDVTAEAFACALSATRDPNGQWILSPHSEAFSESGWAGIVSGNLRLVRVDRLFHAGLEPRQPGNDALWIIDYKTAHAENIDVSSALPAIPRHVRTSVADVRCRSAQSARARPAASCRPLLSAHVAI